MTQRMASTRFDFPQPFGPTTPVRPGSIWKSVASQKLLKPTSRKRLNFMPKFLTPPMRHADAGHWPLRRLRLERGFGALARHASKPS